ncbi:transposon-encoded TnpW family protein [Corynebacterium pseudotuberculosis]|uniref:transposon-encoded TnpW family protein n=1 Tax=Corynebacterium pseudotuberculosis TaxID=1719 RepID=UPI0009354F52|nr:transposon-encoded TnpW family protein [Corynebacterium pseudotuberculosis]WFP67786.1 transposon-encoded TnpW family protein [Corynebacterium pseudotuberculosis]
MAENEKVQSSEIQTNEERNIPPKPDGIITKKINGKTFVTEIYFDKNSKDTFQDKLLKVVQSERKE